MVLGPQARKAALTAHVTASVGWVGVVVLYLVLAAIGVASDDVETVRAVYVAMDVAGPTVLMPFALATLITGLVQSWGTPWGVLRHYWVVVKLVITVVATGVLIAYLGTLDQLAVTATETGVPLEHMQSSSPILHSAAALLLLLGATTLSVFKPKGLTRRGLRWRQGQASSGA